MPRHETRRHTTERFGCRAHHIAFGAADIGQNRLPQIHARQPREHFFHGQDRHRQLNHISALACSCQVILTTINHTQLDRQLARLRIEIDPDHFAADTAFTQAFGKRTTDQPQTDHHKATDHRCSRLQCSDITHEPEPCATLQGSGCFPPVDRWSPAGGSACRSWPPDARSRLRAASPEISEQLPDRDRRR
ncbi:hypothetical protein D3C87_1052370 [compost metagenome]